MRIDVMRQIEETGFIAVADDHYEEGVLPSIAEALLEGGASLLELKYDIGDLDRTNEASEAVMLLKSQFGDELHVGVGGIFTKAQVRLAVSAGAEFISSPDSNADIINETLAAGLVSLPGAMTPTEITLANRCGADYVRFFPAGTAGEPYFKAIHPSIKHVKLIVSGGVTLENYKRFLISGAFGAAVGQNIINDRFLSVGNYQGITNVAKQYIRTKKETPFVRR